MPLSMLEGTHPVPGEGNHVKLHAIARGQNCSLFNVREGRQLLNCPRPLSLQQSQPSGPAHTHKSRSQIVPDCALKRWYNANTIIDKISDERLHAEDAND